MKTQKCGNITIPEYTKTIHSPLETNFFFLVFIEVVDEPSTDLLMNHQQISIMDHDKIS